MAQDTAVSEPLPTARAKPARTIEVDAAKAAALVRGTRGYLATPRSDVYTERYTIALRDAAGLLQTWLELIPEDEL